MASDGFRSERRDEVLVMVLDRPEARNALNGATSRAMAAAVDELEADSSLRAGVLTGAGGTFCAGMDLKAFLENESPNIPGRGMGGITVTPPRKPLIAAVEGHAVAGGFELVLACDMVVASESARFGLPEVKRALVAAGGGALRLPHRVPHAIAMEMLLTGDPIDAARAAEVGLVNKVVADGDALDAALELAGRVTGNGPLALAATKLLVERSRDWPGEEAFERQEEYIEPVFSSEDAREGATAFAEKRAPKWRGQ